ncbi:uncharacterized protein LOC130170861 isoform X2 [Seriola aureovittata]|uniref:uncharacterized protein LOC130170861 isoform X2 n=1 Tax=Seriola aureovittata TaxID=2871759 RepID=UPI0024BEDED9|nr:uncharacterized protein LOC130170861 isoform X2 [Seriola aureovittata]
MHSSGVAIAGRFDVFLLWNSSALMFDLPCLFPSLHYFHLWFLNIQLALQSAPSVKATHFHGTLIENPSSHPHTHTHTHTTHTHTHRFHVYSSVRCAEGRQQRQDELKEDHLAYDTMEMRLKQLALVLFTVAAAALGGSDQQCVIVGTTQVKVDLGSSLTLCCLLFKDTYIRFRVSWYFNQAEPSLNNSQNISETIAGENISTQGETHLTLQNVMHNNSGWYFCKVTSEIPCHTITYSNGTEVVIVTHQEQSLLPFAWWVWIVLGVSAFILMVLLITYTLLRKRCNRSGEDPVYINMRCSGANKQPSPRPGAQNNHLKTSPSSADLQTPDRYGEGKRRQKP